MTDQIAKMRAREARRGRHADAPESIPANGWKDVLWRTWGEINEDRVTLIAAGTTYYLLLSLFPTLTAFVSLYGLFTDPSTVGQHVSLLSAVVPAGGMEVINEQLTRLTQQGGVALSLELVISLAIALWSSSTGVKTLFEAMNMAYDEKEERNFFILNGLALLFTIGGLVAAVAMIGVVVVMPLVLGLLGLLQGYEWLAQALGYLLLIVVLFAGILGLYRFGPSRQQAKWRWLIPGAILAVLLILVASLLFSWYSANFANYEKTYGSLGAVIGFLIWIWISVTVVIVGAELNSEAEHQTAKDSTIGPDAPMGMRDATMADTLGKSTKEGGDTLESMSGAHEWGTVSQATPAEFPPRHRRPTIGGLAFALPAVLLVAWLGRRRRAARH